MPDLSPIRAAADALLAARSENRLIDALPFALGDDDAAYAVQDAVRAALGESISAWKVSMVEGRPPGYAPILSGGMVENGGAWRLPPGGNVLGVEAEIAFVISHDVRARRDGSDLSEDEVAAHFAGAAVAIEVAASRFRDNAAQPRLSAMADFMANGSFVCGAPLHDWRHRDLATLRVRLEINGRTIIEKTGGNPAAPPLTSTTWLANALIRKGLHLAAGQIVTTGSYTGITPVKAGDRAVVSFEGVGECEISFVG